MGLLTVRRARSLLVLLFAVGLLTSCGSGVLYAPAGGHATLWLQENGSAQAESHRADGPEPPLRLLWSQSVSDPPLAGPRFAGSLLLITTKGSTIYSLDVATGHRLGKKANDDPLCAPTAVAGRESDLLLLSQVGKHAAILGLDRRTGNHRWKWEASVCQPLVTRGDTLYAVVEGGQLVAIDVYNGELIWQSDFDPAPKLLSPASVTAEKVYRADGTDIVALQRSDGQSVWRKAVGGRVRTRLAVDGDLHQLFAVTGNGRVLALDADAGDSLWSQTIDGLPASALSLTDSLVVVTSSNRTVYAFHRDYGDVVWRYNTGGVLTASASSTAATVFVGSGDGTLYALAADSGDLQWKYDLDAPALTNIALEEDMLALTTEAGTVYLFQQDRHVYDR
ncbi:MAG: PQQ-binding-like beta-propeller repeat protein [Candidatus Latescibacterota bacterium]|nr:PQQ-binding-like beta-propeller repeat protein [Candidatus Latescibacterota bacterium]